MATESNREIPTTIAELGAFDVLCGRDKKCSINGGNRRFRALINDHVSRYEGCESKFERSKAIGAIVKILQENPEGSVRFFKRVKGSDTNDDHARIEQLDEKQSREKVAHALRDYASQRRNNKAKQQPAPLSPVSKGPESSYRVFPGSNPPSNTSNSVPNTQGGSPSPHISDLMKEEAKLLAEIQALENAETFASQGAYQNYGDTGQNGYPNSQLHSFKGTQSESVNNYNQQQQYYRQQQQYQQHHHNQQYHSQPRQQTLDNENEGSEGYDDFNVEDYNDFIKPLGSSLRQGDIPVANANRYVQQQLKQPIDQASEGYDNFDDRIHPLQGGSSLRSKDSFEKSGSNRSVKKQVSLRQMEVFEKSGSNRSIKHQGSLRHMDVFERSGRASLSKSHGDSIGAMDLMRMSMDTLTLDDSAQMNQSDVYPLGDSILSFDQSKLDMSKAKLDISMPTLLDSSMQQMSSQKLELSMPTLATFDGSMQQMSTQNMSLPTLDSSMQQSKLDMSLQTIDASDVLGQKRSSP